MLATFVIGLREGLEAALIVGIVAAFLVQDGRRSALRAMWTGVAAAIVICLGIGLALTLLSGSLPQRQQEMLETVIGAVAVVMVTWMVLWMRRHARDLKRELGAAVQGALARGSSLALVAMAFLAVIREGVETAVFLVAASQTRGGTTTFVGAGLGIAVAVGLGVLVYRGGVRIDLSRFFRVTGAVLVLVAGGVLMGTLQHAHEADWLTAGTRTWIDLSAVLTPGSVAESLLGGIFGLQAQLSAVAVIGWLLYVVPMMLVVLWPPRRPLPARTVGRLLLAAGVAAAVVGVALRLLVTPPAPVAATTLQVSGEGAAVTLTVSGDQVRLDRAELDGRDATPTSAATGTLALTGASTVAGRSVTAAAAAVPLAAGTPTTADRAAVAALAGGRMPVGLGGAGVTSWTVTPQAAATVTVRRDAGTGVVVGAEVRVERSALVAAGAAVSRVAQPAAVLATPAGTLDAAVAAAAARDAAAGRAQIVGLVLPVALWVWAAVLLVAAALLLRRRPVPAAAPTDPRDRRPAVAAPARAGDTPA